MSYNESRQIIQYNIITFRLKEITLLLLTKLFWIISPLTGYYYLHTLLFLFSFPFVETLVHNKVRSFLNNLSLNTQDEIQSRTSELGLLCLSVYFYTPEGKLFESFYLIFDVTESFPSHNRL